MSAPLQDRLAGRLSALRPEQRALFDKLRERQRQAAARPAQAPPVRRVTGPTAAGDWPLSLDQERFWFMEQLYPSGAGLHITAATRMRGPLSVPGVTAALGEIVRRHAAWRTAFPLVDGRPVQRVAPPRPQPLALIDLTALPAARREAEALRLAGEGAAAPFPLETGPLVRSALVRLGGADHVCLLAVHHLATDWISFQIAFAELAALLSGTPAAALPEPPVQYPDFAVWQRDWLQGEALEGLASWWRGRLAGFPLALELPTDRPRPAVARMRGGRTLLRSSRGLAEALHRLARGEGATLFMAVLAAAAALLHRLSGQERLILGANNANRSRPELEAVLGCFLTQVPFPIDLAGDPTFRELLARVRQSALGSFAHQDLPFGKLVEALQPERDTSRQPIVQALVQVLDGQYTEAALGGVTFEPVDAWDGVARYDLMLTLFDYPGGMVGALEHDAGLFDGATARRMAELLFLQMERAAAEPDARLSALPVLSAAARHQALVEWNDTARPLPGWTVPERFAARAALAPEAVAVIAAGERLTYGELDRRATALARRLRAAGVAAESRVALLLPRTPDVPVALLGVWKAGGAFVPLDLDAPAARIADLLEDAQPAAAVFRGAPPVPLPAGVAAVDLADLRPAEAGELPAVRPGQLAYLLYTSGTTGRPKAALVEHGSLAAILGSLIDRIGFGPGDRLPHLGRFTFDISLAELFAPLLTGGVSEILALDEVLDPDDLLDALERSTRVIVGPALLQRLAGPARERGAARFAGLRTILTGGEAVPPALRGELLAAFPATDLRVLYGPTETAILATDHPVRRGRRHERSLLGRPLDGVEVRVMDARGHPVALGTPGELWIGGAGVGRGYFRRPELTAERFVEVDGRRFYRSGDLVRQLPSEGGELEFLGRTDHQVKLRGFRIEPGEIEAALLGHPAVQEAAVVPRGEGEALRLVGYVAGQGVDAAGLREHLAARLPAHMVPAAFVVLPELPLTANAKVDRARLPAPQGPPEEAGEAPRTPAEEVVAGIWCEVLGLERVSRAADFFALGGHSLLATQVVTRLRAATGAELAVRDLFQAPTVAALAAAVAAALSAGAAPAPPIVPVPRDRDLPLSFAQERLWFLDRLVPGIAAYHIPLAVALRGGLAPAAMEAALGGLVARHEALRTRFAEGVQIVEPPAPWTLPRVDLSALPEGARSAEARRLASEEAVRPFDLAAGPVLRSVLLRLGPAEHALLLCVHHIAADGWSVGVMIREIAAIYRAAVAGAAPSLPALPVQYADFAVWQRQWLRGEELERQLAYWRGRLEGAPRLDLPADRPRPAVQRFRGGLEAIRLPAARVRRRDATPFMVLLAAFQALLARHTGQDDVVVGSPIANRNRAEIEPLVGFFVNTLVLRGDLSGDPPFAVVLAAARRAALEAYSHQDLPFERLVEEMRPERRLSLNPLFQAVLAVQNAPLGEVELPGLSLAPAELDFPVTRFDLEVMAWEAGGELTLQLVYDAGLFDRATIERLAGRFERLLAAVAQRPELRVSELPLLAAGERRQLLRLGSGPAPRPGAGFLDRILAQPPEALAVGGMSYGELVARACRLARELRIGPDVPVGLHVERSPELVVGALAVLLAGGAYVPLDPSHPEERLAGIVRESGMPALLSRTPPAWAGEARVVLLGGGRASFEPVRCPPESLAYVIYTSGSTGRPKGVQVPRGGLQALVDWHLRACGVTARDRATLIASPSFDASVWEIWPCLAAGASLHIPDEETRLSPERLLAWMAAERITLAFLPTPLAALAVAAEIPAGLALRRLLTGGDRLENGPRRPLPFELVNHYGPTESSVVATAAPVPVGSERPPIGRPIDGARAFVLDGWELAPEGVPGELALGGAGLARGYLGRPGLTAERFVPDPFGAPGERLYRTGDRVRWRGGTLEFLGRIDRQIKLRGFRIEPGEIEAALRRHPRVREAAVKAEEGLLAAWVVPRPAGETPSPAEHIERWQELYDETYGRGPATEDLSFNLQGWNSSYTGEPIPAGEMREWLEGTVERLLALPHRRVLEVGCGTGLLLFRVAPEAERYLGTDFSAVALEQVRAGLGRLPQVELDRRLADDWTGVAPGSLDLVVLNSVVQYFPGVDYLVRALEGAVAAVAPGGAVFVGDVRSLPLLEAFAESVERFRSPGLPQEELRQRVRRRVADEEELVVDPRLFLALAKRLPGVGRVELRVKRGRGHNELTRYRYDAVLHVGAGAPSPAQPGRAGEGSSLSGVEERLSAEPETLAFTLPNARLAPGVDPEEARSLGERLGYEVELALDPDPFRFGALFRRRGSAAGFPEIEWPEVPDLPWSAFANDPLRAGEERRLVPGLRRFLEAGLPDFMVPSAFVLLESLPLTPSGKVDFAALPAPGRTAGTAEGYVAPASPLEEQLARAAAELLGLPRVGMRDNFFDLGGHSLLATQLVSRLGREHGIEVTLQMVFDSATLADLADRIVAAGLAAADGAELLALLEEIQP